MAQSGHSTGSIIAGPSPVLRPCWVPLATCAIAQLAQGRRSLGAPVSAISLFNHRDEYVQNAYHDAKGSEEPRGDVVSDSSDPQANSRAKTSANATNPIAPLKKLIGPSHLSQSPQADCREGSTLHMRCVATWLHTRTAVQWLEVGSPRRRNFVFSRSNTAAMAAASEGSSANVSGFHWLRAVLNMSPP